MNIIIVNDFASINGGAGQVALTSAIELAKRGNRVIVFAAVLPIMPSLVESGVEIVITDQFAISNDANRTRAVMQGVWNFKSQEYMKRLLLSLDRSDTIVHIHSWRSALSASVVRSAINYGFNVVCTFHDYASACPNGGFFDYKIRQICKEVPLSIGCVTRNCDVKSYPQKLWRVLRQFTQNKFGLLPSGIKHFIAVSDFSSSILKPFLPADAFVYRINNPINVNRGNCINAGLNDTFTFVGRLSPEKGGDLFARAANSLGISPVFVGEGELESLILSICSASLITGWVSSDQVQKFISVSRALVLPSLLYEGCPLVINEAAALGIPAIVPDTCAARDLVENGRTGLWFEGGNDSDLASKIRILQQSDVATMMGRAAYDRYWSSPSTTDLHVNSLIDCYLDIMENN
jgi:glycosyltransferase involved in cell wall biosynthesis